MTVLTFPQGTTSPISVNSIVDGNGAPLNITGWAIDAKAVGPGTPSPLVAEWSTSPVAGQYQATVIAPGTAISFDVASTMPWSSSYAILNITVTEPGVGGRVEKFPPIGLIATP
jgi:hypothetical protein